MDFLEKIRGLEENKRRQILVILSVISAAAVLLLLIGQIKAIFKTEMDITNALDNTEGLPSIEENLRSSMKDLLDIVNDLKSGGQTENGSAEPPAASASPTPDELPPAVKLPTE